MQGRIMRDVSCVIPAFNEAARIETVLIAALAHPLIAEVIVVDDGSSDGTAQIAQAMGARVIVQPQNGGKTRALRDGIAAARGDFLLLLDADLERIGEADITALLTPVLAAQTDVSISLRGNSPTPWRALGLDYISGERVLPRIWVLDRLADLDTLAGFGFEVWLNAVWIDKGARIAVVPWPGVRSPLKSEKAGLLAGIRADLGMMRDIFRTVSPLKALRQIATLRGLRA
jgi:glycosyltransferase involved in cell wall biosynthesis